MFEPKITFFHQNAIFNKRFFDLLSHQHPYDPHFGIVINDVKFRISMSNSFRRVKLIKAVKHKIACCVASNR